MTSGADGDGIAPGDGDPILLAQANWRRTGWDAGPHFLAGLSVVAAEQQIRTAGVPALAPLGLTHARHEALAVLYFSRHGELPLSVLSRQLLLHLTSVTATVDALVRLGFVERVPHRDDRRTTLARITVAGRAAMEESCTRLAALRFGVGALTEREATELFRLLTKVRRAPAVAAATCQPRANADAPPR
jgi:DNA-binding MarR family transcriptional regulator